jgi:hypothetical protein
MVVLIVIGREGGVDAVIYMLNNIASFGFNYIKLYF